MSQSQQLGEWTPDTSNPFAGIAFPQAQICNRSAVGGAKWWIGAHCGVVRSLLFGKDGKTRYLVWVSYDFVFKGKNCGFVCFNEVFAC